MQADQRDLQAFNPRFVRQKAAAIAAAGQIAAALQ
jgi:hypothetical protein